jgi:glucose-1-phosphate cytidylyltransferase
VNLVPPNDEIPVVIFCGGYGTRIREVSESLPKPMIDIGGQPVLWHIMKIYSHYGFRRFVLALGYKGNLIKDYFLNYRRYQSDFTVRLATSEPPLFHSYESPEDWEVTCVDTGIDTYTAGRLSRVRRFLDTDTFCVTYGDGVAALDVPALIETHQRHGLVGTVTAVRPTSRFGELDVEGDRVRGFQEKPMLSRGFVNGGFFVFQRQFLDYVDDDAPMLEEEALQNLTKDGQLGFHLHEGFWRGMDTYREYVELNKLWDEGTAEWKCW